MRFISDVLKQNLMSTNKQTKFHKSLLNTSHHEMNINRFQKILHCHHSDVITMIIKFFLNFNQKYFDRPRGINKSLDKNLTRLEHSFLKAKKKLYFIRKQKKKKIIFKKKRKQINTSAIWHNVFDHLFDIFEWTIKNDVIY